VRKDSALYLEEEAETLALRKPARTDAPDAPRRQSSGYVSTRGSFDENRGDATQDPYPRERRRSSKLSSKVLAGRVEESIDETDTAEETMPTSEVHRKMSSGLDAASVEEIKGASREQTQHPREISRSEAAAAANISKSLSI